MKSIESYKEEMMKLYKMSGQSAPTASTVVDKTESLPKQNEKTPNTTPRANSQMQDGTGGLVVWVTTLRNLYAVPNARVEVYDRNNTLIDFATTDISGRTRQFILKTPPKNYSDDPTQTQLPYAFYRINVKADGYVEQNLERVTVFPTITSIQPVDMILNSASNTKGEVG